MQAGTMVAMGALLLAGGAAMADSFGTDENHFVIDFVTISGDTNPASGRGIVSHDYRMGTFEVTNDQWDRFVISLGVPVTGNPLGAYTSTVYSVGLMFTGTNVPTTVVSWYEAAQFVNWLNTSTDHQAAYKFTGTQGTGDYALATWSAAEADNGTNLYRHKDAFYYLPTEDEWVKAGYWNGTSLQTHATKAGDTLHQGDGLSGTGWNYHMFNDDYTEGWYATDPIGPWDVGSGSEELNGTFDMMGNVWEWMETSCPYDPSYAADAVRMERGGSYYPSGTYPIDFSSADATWNAPPDVELQCLGFRVASRVPEPAALALLALGGLAIIRRRGPRIRRA